MQDYRYVVTVTCASEEEAATVIAERIYHDEDYGFDYTIAALAEEVNA